MMILTMKYDIDHDDDIEDISDADEDDDVNGDLEYLPMITAEVPL